MLSYVRNMEKDLKKEIQELDKKIETDAICYKSDLRILYDEIKEAREQVKKHHKRYEELLSQQRQCEKELSAIRVEAESSHGYKFARFQISVTPLEQAEKKIEGQKKKLMERIVPEKRALSVIEDRLEMLGEDLEGRKRKGEELQREKEQLEKQMQEFNVNASGDFQLVLEDLDNENQLNKINEEKAAFEALIAKNEGARLELMKTINSNEELIKKLRVQDVMGDKHLQAAIATNMKQINELEQAIEDLCKLAPNDLANLILETAKSLSMSTDAPVFSLQNKLIEAQITQIVKEESKSIEEMKESVRLLKESKGSAEEVRREEEKVSVKSLLLKEKMQAVELWRTGAKSLAEVGEADLLPKKFIVRNSELHQAVIGALQEKGGEGMREIAREYFDKLDERERAVQRVMARAENVRSHMEELQDESRENAGRLEAMESEGQKQKAKFRELCVAAKSIESKMKAAEQKINALLKESFKSSVTKSKEAKKGKTSKDKANTFSAVKQKNRKQKIRTLYKRLREVSRFLSINKDVEGIEMQIKSVCTNSNNSLPKAKLHQRKDSKS